MSIIDIHPLDFAEILNAADGPADIIKYRVEVVEVPDTKYKGLYRQTVEVPVTSAFGKKIVEDVSK